MVKIKYLYKISILFLCFFLVFSRGTAVWAETARFSELVVSNTGDDLLLYTNIKGAFNEKITEAVKSGVPATFSIYINLHQTRDLWFDKKIKEKAISHALRYDNIKEEYIVERSWEDGQPLVTESFTEATRRMCNIQGLPICEMNKLDKGGKYRIEAKAELDKMTLPFYLHYVFFFLAFWNFETDWHTKSFTY